MAARFKLTAPHVLERSEQTALFQWAAVEARRDPRLHLLNASQNGMRASSIQQAAMAKRCGMKKGFPDVFLPVPSGVWHGLFIEMKRKDGVQSDVSQEQRQWLTALRGQGYHAVVCYGWESAAQVIRLYLDAKAVLEE